uniref:Uncharacterized protein n=1 Tax=Lactuca sativa TaxID=4236 RepID=A0A9R1WPY3_LACSA|nr:hypothetical protein LSAT_V11C100013520 [Lactuca sativa]
MTFLTHHLETQNASTTTALYAAAHHHHIRVYKHDCSRSSPPIHSAASAQSSTSSVCKPMKLPTWIGGRRPILMSTRPPPFDANLSGDMISINGWQATGGSSRELSPEEEMLIIHSTSMAAEPLTKVGNTFCLISRR